MLCVLMIPTFIPNFTLILFAVLDLCFTAFFYSAYCGTVVKKFKTGKFCSATLNSLPPLGCSTANHFSPFEVVFEKKRSIDRRTLSSLKPEFADFLSFNKGVSFQHAQLLSISLCSTPLRISTCKMQPFKSW